MGRRARGKRDAAIFVPLNAEGKFHHTQDQFVNEMEVDTEAAKEDDSDVSLEQSQQASGPILVRGLRLYLNFFLLTNQASLAQMVE